MEKLHISIYGMCVLRDIFALQEKKGNEKYIIDRFVQSISPIPFTASAFPLFLDDEIKSKIEDLSMKIFYDTSNFYKRMMLFNLFCDSDLYLKEVQSEYLLLDIGCLRFDLWWLGNNKEYPIGITPLFKKYYKRMMEMNLFPKEYTETNILSITDVMLYDYLDLFIAKIKKMYELDKIILFEEYAIYEYLDKNGELYYNSINEAEKFNSIVGKGFSYLVKKMRGCHVIRCPRGVLGDEKHRWGVCQYHYISEYYEYAYKAMDIIVANRNSRLVEAVLLANLLEETERDLFIKYDSKRRKLHKSMLNNERVMNRLDKYISYFEQWILEEKDINIEPQKTVAFYGLSKICMMLLKLCEKKKIDVIYIVENGLDSYQKYPVFSRDFRALPKVDYLIISDFRIDAIKRKLEQYELGDCVVTDIFEIIGETNNVNYTDCY